MDTPDADMRVAATGEAASWAVRQAWMESEYDQLLNDGDHAARAFENDYRGISPFLNTCRGRILDIGGGVGVTRHWLPCDASHVLVEPSRMWDDPRWLAHAERFPCLRERPVHVRAYAEALPFETGAFDVALFLWSLNHVCDPAASISEARRILKPRGRMLVVLEDMDPALPLQPDHLRVDEGDLTRDGFLRQVARSWISGYLTLELQAV